MNKIIIQIGLLIFFISLVVFGKIGLPIQDVLMRALLAAITISIMISIVAILLVKALNNVSVKKEIASSNPDKKS
jgi:multisubunit Na+/H+ antiporter MnhG subunit